MPVSINRLWEGPHDVIQGRNLDSASRTNSTLEGSTEGNAEKQCSQHIFGNPQLQSES